MFDDEAYRPTRNPMLIELRRLWRVIWLALFGCQHENTQRTDRFERKCRKEAGGTNRFMFEQMYSYNELYPRLTRPPAKMLMTGRWHSWWLDGISTAFVTDTKQTRNVKCERSFGVNMLITYRNIPNVALERGCSTKLGRGKSLNFCGPTSALASELNAQICCGGMGALVGVRFNIWV